MASAGILPRVSSRWSDSRRVDEAETLDCDGKEISTLWQICKMRYKKAKALSYHHLKSIKILNTWRTDNCLHIETTKCMTKPQVCVKSISAYKTEGQYISKIVPPATTQYR